MEKLCELKSAYAHIPPKTGFHNNEFKGSTPGTFDANVVESSKRAYHLAPSVHNSVWPAHSLYVLRQSGLEPARGANTTTNFEEFSANEIAMAVEGEQIESFDMETCYDADNRQLIDTICDCYRGVGLCVASAQC